MVIFVSIVAIAMCTYKSNTKKCCVKEIKYKSTVRKQALLISLSINGLIFLLYAFAMDIAAIAFESKTFSSDTRNEAKLDTYLICLPTEVMLFDLIALIIYSGALCAVKMIEHCCDMAKDLRSFSIINVIPSLLGPLLGFVNHFPFIVIAYINDSYYASSIFVYYMVIFFVCFVAVHLTMRAFLGAQLPEPQTESNIWSCIFKKCGASRCICSSAVSIVLLIVLLSAVFIVICYLIIIPVNGSVSGATHQLIVFYQTIIIFLGIFITYRTVIHKKHGGLKSAIRNRKTPLKINDSGTSTQWRDIPDVEKTVIYHDMVLDLVKHFHDKNIASASGSDYSSVSEYTMVDTPETSESGSHRDLSQTDDIPQISDSDSVRGARTSKVI